MSVPSEVRVLGPLEATVGARLVLVNGKRSRIVLAHLARSAPCWTTAERLADLAWGECQPRNPRKAVQMHVVRLRRLLGQSVVETGLPGHYRLGAGWTRDVDRFLDLARCARFGLEHGHVEQARALAGDALALWRGDPWSDLDDDLDSLADREALMMMRSQLELLQSDPMAVPTPALGVPDAIGPSSRTRLLSRPGP